MTHHTHKHNSYAKMSVAEQLAFFLFYNSMQGTGNNGVNIENINLKTFTICKKEILG